MDGAEQPRRRAGALLAAYYGIAGADGSNSAANAPPVKVEADIDKAAFDAQAHFDSIVAKERVSGMLRKANELDGEVRDLDGDMQMVAYENYSKFIRATDVTKSVKTTVEGMEPDMKLIETSVKKCVERQREVESAVSGRAIQIESLLKQQQQCKKLKVLFNLPATLRQCLDRREFGRACAAYATCAPFLRQHVELASFKRILEDVELQMGLVRSAVEERLSLPELTCDEAVKSSLTLIDLGESRAGVVRGYLKGRSAALGVLLANCFASATPKPADSDADAQPLSADAAFSEHCQAAAERYIPGVQDAAEGFRMLQKAHCSRSSEKLDDESLAQEEEALDDFIGSRVQDVLVRISSLVVEKRPSPRTLLACVNMTRDALRRACALKANVVGPLLTAFLSGTISDAMQMIFAEVAEQIYSALLVLHTECKRFQETKHSAGSDGVPPAVSTCENAMLDCSEAALEQCRPLLDLVESGQPARQSCIIEMRQHLLRHSRVFGDFCNAFTSREVEDTALSSKTLTDVEALEWTYWFGASLVWLGRRLDEKVVGKVWTKGAQMFAGLDDGQCRRQGVCSGQTIAESVLQHYVMVSGQRLAHFFRNSIRRLSNASTSQEEPTEPSVVVDMVLKEVHEFDAQLGRMLGDVRKPRPASQQRRRLELAKDPMELEMESLWARKLQVYAPVPCSRPAAVLGILRISFKALFEYVREETLTRRGLQQIQLDCALLAYLFRDYVDAQDVGVLDGLLGEALTSASKRCEEPTLLSKDVLERLCDAMKRSMKAE